MRTAEAVAAGEPEPGASASALWRAAGARVKDTVDLAAAEVRLAVMTAVTMLVLGLLAVAAVLAGWAFVVAALAALAVAAGWSWPAVAGAIGAGHLLLAALLLRAALVMSRDLTLPALRRALLGRAGQP